MTTFSNPHERIEHLMLRVEQLEAALRGLLEIEDARIGTGAFQPNEEAKRRIAVARALTSVETGAQPGIGPMEPEPQDYKVQCRCGWMGQVSALKSLPGFKMGCPDCSTEFVPLNKMTFPIDRNPK
jgi:hypothetical protein